jgi:hypothetical protein
MELFLNLCWLSLLVPGVLLWRQRRVSTAACGSLAFICVLGCALILLFPVISATDDLHAMRPEMEESERGFRHAGNCGCSAHALAQASSQLLLPSSARLTVAFEQMGTVHTFVAQTPVTFAAPATGGRAPPSANSAFAHPAAA